MGGTQEFLDNYADWEIGKMRERLSQLKKYPITEYSRNYLDTCERLSQIFHEKTGRFPVLFAESHPLEVGMYAKGGSIMDHELMMDNVSDKEQFSDFAKSFGLGFSQYYASAREFVQKLLEGKDLLPKVERHSEFGGCDGHMGSVQERESALQTLAGFISSVPLNSHTRSLQQSLLEKVEEEELRMDNDAKMANPEKPKKASTIKDRIAVSRARRLYYLCHEYQQRRAIDEFIKRKNGLKAIEIASEAPLDMEKEMSHFKRFVLEIPMAYSDD